MGSVLSERESVPDTQGRATLGWPLMRISEGLGGEISPFAQSPQLRPNDVACDHLVAGERAEAAIHARNHACGIPYGRNRLQNAVRHHLCGLDIVGRGVDHARYQRLIRGPLRGANALVLMLVA